MKLTADIACKSLTKYGEELCGDRTEILKAGDGVILILADGMGSGVKANILATLTSKILGTMIRNGADIEDCVRTVARTLPVCQIRNAAYSTFSILKLDSAGHAHLIEFDNPACIFLRNGTALPLSMEEIQLEGKTIHESRFSVEIGDYLLLLSDGVTFAGLGTSYPFGWTRDGVSDFAAAVCSSRPPARELVSLLCRRCLELYDGRPGDDTTLLAAQIVRAKALHLFWGPPEDPGDDTRLMNDFMAKEALRVICGTTSADIAARFLHGTFTANPSDTSGKYPLLTDLDGIDLVTENAQILAKTLSLLKQAAAGIFTDSAASDCGARLAHMMLEECTEVQFFISRRLDGIQQNFGLTFETGIRMTLVRQLSEVLEQLGRPVTIHCY